MTSSSSAMKYCLHDGCKFDGDSYYFPMKFENNFFHVNNQEVFCSLGCAFKWALTTRKSPSQLMTFKDMCKQVYNVYTLSPAPDRCMLTKHNGPYTVKEFRKKSPIGTVTVKYSNSQKPFKDDVMQFKEFERTTHSMPEKPKVSNNILKVLSGKRKRPK